MNQEGKHIDWSKKVDQKFLKEKTKFGEWWIALPQETKDKVRAACEKTEEPQFPSEEGKKAIAEAKQIVEQAKHLKEAEQRVAEYKKQKAKDNGPWMVQWHHTEDNGPWMVQWHHTEITSHWNLVPWKEEEFDSSGSRQVKKKVTKKAVFAKPNGLNVLLSDYLSLHCGGYHALCNFTLGKHYPIYNEIAVDLLDGKGEDARIERTMIVETIDDGGDKRFVGAEFFDAETPGLEQKDYLDVIAGTDMGKELKQQFDAIDKAMISNERDNDDN